MSSRFKLKLVGVVVALLALVAVGVGWSAHAAGGPPFKSNPPPPTYPTFQIQQTYVQGSPGIKPRFKQYIGENTSSPSFTKADVVAFLNRYGFAPVVKGAHMTILSTQFVSAQQASKLMDGESVGRPPNALVCYVEVEGPFLLTGISVPHQPGKHYPTTAKYGHMVFDAHTGNGLVWGLTSFS